MWTQMVQRLRKPSLSTANMADVLFEIATDKEAQDSLIEAAGLGSVEGLCLTKARTELMLLNLCAIYNGVFSSDELKQRHRNKLDKVYLNYLARFNGTQPLEFLRIYEVRLFAYSKVFESWYRAHQNKRGHEQSLAIGEAFFHFCGAACFNPISLSILQHHFFTVIRTVFKTLDEYRLV